MTTTLLALFLTAVTPFVPTEPVLIALGARAAVHPAQLAAIIPVAALGCWFSDHLLYAAARVAGRGWIRRRATGPLAAQLARWGLPALVAGRWLPAGGTVAALAAGTGRWPLARFTPASALGCTLWSGYAALLGYVGGALAGRATLGTLASIPVAAAIALTAALLQRRAARRPDGARSVADPAGGPGEPDQRPVSVK